MCWRWMASTVFLLGCGGNVVVDGASAGKGGASGTGGSPAGGGGAPTWTALVTTTPDPSGPCSMNANLNPADAVFVIVANQPITCAQTLPQGITATHDTCGPTLVWEVCIAVSSSSLAVGSIDLGSGVNAEESDEGGCAYCCSGGSKLGGALQITAVAASTVTFQLSANAMSAGGLIDTSGTHTALRCP